MRMPQTSRPKRVLLPGEAEIVYLDADLRVLNSGNFVLCAVTGAPIPIDDLKYWNVEKQEAYASLPVAIARWKELKGRSATP